MDFWVSPAAPQKKELKTAKLPALSWLSLLRAHCWSIAHTARCQDQFRCQIWPSDCVPHRCTLIRVLAVRRLDWAWLKSRADAHARVAFQNQSSYWWQEETRTRRNHGGAFVSDYYPGNLQSGTGFRAVKVAIYSPPAARDYPFHIINLSLHLTFKWETCSRLELLLKGRLPGADICSVAIRSGIGKYFWKLLHIKVKIFLSLKGSR